MFPDPFGYWEGDEDLFSGPSLVTGTFKVAVEFVVLFRDETMGILIEGHVLVGLDKRARSDRSANFQQVVHLTSWARLLAGVIAMVARKDLGEGALASPFGVADVVHVGDVVGGKRIGCCLVSERNNEGNLAASSINIKFESQITNYKPWARSSPAFDAGQPCTVTKCKKISTRVA